MKPKIIVLTPVKNEEWILDTFLRATSLWADYIIISDNCSTDKSREIASAYAKVILIDNPMEEFNEYQMRAPMIAKAREIEGEKIIFSLDADEILTYPFCSQEWELLLRQPQGTIIQFPLLNIRPGFTEYWRGDILSVGIIDDGRQFETGLIHVPRMFLPQKDDGVFECKELAVLHYEYVDWKRLKSKHQWYQYFERIQYPNKSRIDIYRFYHHMYNPYLNFLPTSTQWFEEYKAAGANIQIVTYFNSFWWDKKVQEYISTYGASYFSGLIENEHTYIKHTKTLRNCILQLYLKQTTKLYYYHGVKGKIVRKVDKILKRIGV